MKSLQRTPANNLKSFLQQTKAYPDGDYSKFDGDINTDEAGFYHFAHIFKTNDTASERYITHVQMKKYAIPDFTRMNTQSKAKTQTPFEELGMNPIIYHDPTMKAGKAKAAPVVVEEVKEAPVAAPVEALVVVEPMEADNTQGIPADSAVLYPEGYDNKKLSNEEIIELIPACPDADQLEILVSKRKRSSTVRAAYEQRLEELK